MLELCGMRSTVLLPSLLGSNWLAVVAPDWVLSMGKIELNSVLMLNSIVLNRIVFNIQTVYLSLSELFEIELFICIKRSPSQRLECSPMARETWVQSQVESYQRL